MALTLNVIIWPIRSQLTSVREAIMADCANDFFDVAILKVAARCNINCQYCYMFNLADQSWRQQPKVMSLAVLDAFFEKAEDYISERGLRHFSLVVHGGEPLLAGKVFFRKLGNRARRLAETTGAQIFTNMQTNGLLLDEEWLDVLREAGVTFGLSVDGTREFHDRYRVTFSGHGTHALVEYKINWLNRQPDICRLFRGVLCVIQPEMDGRALVKYFHDLGVPSCDFLLPDQNYSFPSNDFPVPKTRATYGLVLEDAYREWRRIDDQNFNIRIFDELVRSLLGTPPGMDCLGTTPIRIFTIASSGAIEPLDTFKCCGPAYSATGRTIFDTRLSDLASIPNLKIALERPLHSGPECLTCVHNDMCGGGYMPHRFRDGSFRNPSIYCADLKHICAVIKQDVTRELGIIPDILTSYLMEA
jgi:uncharacterized protein